MGDSQSAAAAADPAEIDSRARVPWMLLGLTAIAFAPGLWNGYTLWDDADYIRSNPLLRSLDGLRAIWLTFDAPQYYPLTFTSYWIEYQIWGDWATGYFMVNVALHAGTTLLLWRFLDELRINPTAALIAAGLFAVHPLQAGTVAWLAERKNTLCGVFTMLTLLLYARTARGKGAYWSCVGAFAAALLSKTAVVTLPLSLLALDRLVLRAPWRAALGRVAPLILLAALLGGVTLARERLGAPQVVGQGMNPLGAAAAFWIYVSNVLAPLSLPALYPQWRVDAGDLRWWAPLGGLLAATGLACALRARIDRAALWGLAHFALLLAPGSGLLPFGFVTISPVGDYLVYFGLPGLLLALVLIARRAFARFRAPSAGPAPTLRLWPALVVAGACIPLTWGQVRMWRDGETLWRTTLLLVPESCVAHVNLGSALAEQGRLSEALESFQRALAHDSQSLPARHNVAAALRDLGRLAEAEPIARTLTRDFPAHARAHALLGSILARQARWDDALFELEEALRLEPDAAGAHGAVGEALLRTGRPAAAAERFEDMLRRDAGNAQAWELLVESYVANERADLAHGAIRRGTAALRAAGGDASAQRLEQFFEREPAP